MSTGASEGRAKEMARPSLERGGPGRPPVLALRNLSKTFGGQKALDAVSLDVQPGEVHGLLGENGSGKSTLIKILSGYHAPDRRAELRVNGEPVTLPLAPGESRRLGMTFVHQDLGLAPNMSVLENLKIESLIARRGWRIRWKAERQDARDIFARYDLAIDPAVKIEELSQTEQALVAIIRAVDGMDENVLADPRKGPCLLVLDEPTVFLPGEGVAQLFRVVRDIAEKGNSSVLFVSHNLGEVREVTDRLTVLRDGRVQGTVDTSATTEGRLVEMIIGRPLEALQTRRTQRRAQTPLIKIRGLTGGYLRDVDVDVHRGEIVGVTGLMGSGFDEIPYLIFGARRASNGVLTIDGVDFPLAEMSPPRALRAGLVLLPANRQYDGGVANLSVSDNMMLPVLDRLKGPVGLRRRAMSATAQSLLLQFEVRPPRPEALYETLSGGNQQKVLLAKWMQLDPRVLLLHEPTQGVDVGARATIFQRVTDAARAGAAIVIASSDNEQLALLCHRVLVFSHGRVVREMSGTITKDIISEHVYGRNTAANS